MADSLPNSGLRAKEAAAAMHPPPSKIYTWGALNLNDHTCIITRPREAGFASPNPASALTLTVFPATQVWVAREVHGPDQKPGRRAARAE